MLPVEAEDGVFEELAGGRPVGGLQLQAAQRNVPQPRGQVQWDGGCRGGTGDLKIRNEKVKTFKVGL